jgi:hypothetical protein
MLTGKSLSFCIRDIIEGKVKESDISSIITSTRANDTKQFVSLCVDYSLDYWYINPELGIEIALRLYDEGKIIQPRLKNNKFYQDLSTHQYWITE